MDTTNDNFTFTCPHCEQRLEAEPDMSGMVLDCPNCGKKIQVPDASKQRTSVGTLRQDNAKIAGTATSISNKASPFIRNVFYKWNALERQQRKRFFVVATSIVAVFALSRIACTPRVSSREEVVKSANEAVKAANDALSRLSDEASRIAEQQEEDGKEPQEQIKGEARGKEEPKPWITDSPEESVVRINNEVLKHSGRHERYEQASMSKIRMFPEEYVGRRFVFDKCEVDKEFKEPSSFGIPKGEYFAFPIKTSTSGGKIYCTAEMPFLVKKSFARQWVDKLGDVDSSWGWCVVSGTFQKFEWKFRNSNEFKRDYAFVVDELLACNVKTGEPVGTLTFSENPVSDKRSLEMKSFVVINSRFDLTPKTTPSKTGSKKAQELYVQGMKYYEGDGAIQDYGKAFSLLKEAADLGNLEACARLAWMLCSGQGCKKSNTEGLKYAEKAKSESETARIVLAMLYFCGFEDNNLEWAQSYEKAYAFFSESLSWYASLFFKGLMEYHGVGTEKNLEKAAKSFYSCCEDKPSSPVAGQSAICLAHMYANGEGVAENRTEARKWYKYGLETAYPHLVAEAKKPLTKRDVTIWRNETGGDTITITPFQWRMVKLIGDEGKWGQGEDKMNLLNWALTLSFQPDVGLWKDVKDEM